jgi:hypothetical protein
VPDADAARRVRRILVLATAALFVLRVGMSLARTGPVLMADEGGYLGNARLIGGGLDFVMGSSPFYRAGYSVLMSPLVALGAGPGTTYNLVLVASAALAASLVPLLYLLLTRCFEVAPSYALGGAIAGAAYPTVTSISQVALSENALFPLMVVWLLSVGMLLSASGRRAVWWGLATGACGSALWIVHGRMVVVVAVTGLLLVGLLARRRISAAAGVAGLAALGVGLVAGSVLNDFVVDHNYGGRSVDEVGDTLGSLDDVGAALRILRNLAGETWYLLVASFGILGLLVLVEGPAIVAKLRRRELGVPSLSLILLLVATAGLLLVTAVWFVDPTRPDQIVYGRYIEPTVPPLLALGVVALMRGASRPAFGIVLGGVAVLTVVVAVLAAGLPDFPGEEANRWSVSSLPFVTGDLGPAVIIGAGVVAAAGAWAIAATAARAPWAAWLAVVVLFVPITAFTEARLVLRGEDAVYPAGWTSPQSTVEARSDEVAYDTSHFDNVAVKAYQWFLPDTRFELFDAATSSPPAPLFFSAPAWSREHPDLPARIVWRDPGRNQVLWQLRGD